MNPAYAILADTSKSHYRVLNIYRPDGLLYRSFGEDLLSGSGDFSSTPTSKALDKPSSSISQVLNTSLPDRIILSRQMISWKAEIRIFSTDGINTTDLLLYEGLVTGATSSGEVSTIEITNKASLLSDKPSLILSNNCPRIYGSAGCGLVPTSIWISPTSQVSTSFTFPSTAFQIDPNAQYAVKIGDFSYKVLTINSPAAGQINSVNLESTCLGLPDFINLTTTCDQSLQQCRRYNNSKRYLGSSLPRSPLSIR